MAQGDPSLWLHQLLQLYISKLTNFFLILQDVSSQEEVSLQPAEDDMDTPPRVALSISLTDWLERPLL